METITHTPASRRVFRKLAPRSTVFVEPTAGGRRHVGELLAGLEGGGGERVYLVGPLPGAGGIHGLRAWASGPYPPGWAESERGHYLEGEHPALRFTRPDGGALELLRAAAYFGEGRYSAATARAAWELLEAELQRDWRTLNLLSSPSATGREALLQSLPRGSSWPTLPLELQSLIRRTSGQGRIQLVDGRPATIPQLVAYDGRLMYAALCWGLPGAGEHRRTTEYLGHTRARYYATAGVPRDWARACACGAPGHEGLGLLGYADASQTGWEYPAEPGRTFSGWWDGAEVAIALAHGWAFRFHTALVFNPYTGRGPLDTWAQRLVAVRERLAMLTRGAAGEETPAMLAFNAVRAILLHAIGALHGAPHKATRSLPIEQAGDVPADARDLRVEHDRIVWAEYGGAGWPELSHPEWSAAIWARARARLLHGPLETGALHVPAGDVLAFRTDALYLASDPAWADDGRPGRLRRRAVIAGPLARPGSHAELLEVAGA